MTRGTGPTGLPDYRGAAAWLSFLVLLLLVCSVGLPSPDLWWQLAGGRWMVEGRGFPWVDPFSHTAAGRAWLNHEWLAEIGMYALYRVGGLPLLHLARVVLLLAAFWTVARVARLAGVDEAATACGAAIALLNAQWRFFFDVRPYLFTYFGVAATRYLVERYLRERRPWLLAAIVATFLVWANLHSGVIAGLALLGVLAATGIRSGDARRPLVATWLAAAVACLVNPFGVHLLRLPFEFLGRDSLWTRHLNEWARPDLLGAHADFTVFWCATVTVAYLLRTRLTARDGASLALFAILSLSAWRHLTLFALMAVPVWAALCQEVLRRLSARLPERPAVIWRVALGTAFAACLIIVARVDPQRLSRVRELFPQAGTTFLMSNDLPRRLYNPYGWGGYLTFHAWPRYAVFMDGRANTLYEESTYRDFLDVFSARKDWEDVLRSRQVDVVLINDWETQRYPRSLGDAMPSAAEWQLIYVDPLCGIYLRKSAAAAAGRLRYPAVPLEGVVERAESLIATGRLAAGRALLWQALRQQPSLASAYRVLGVAAVREGRPAAAEKLTRRALDLDPRLPQAHFNLGALLLARGDREGARRELDRELDCNPGFEAARRAREQLDAVSGH